LTLKAGLLAFDESTARRSLVDHGWASPAGADRQRDRSRRGCRWLAGPLALL